MEAAHVLSPGVEPSRPPFAKRMPSAESLVTRDSQSGTGPIPVTEQQVASRAEVTHNHTFETQADAPACHECGSIMVRNGSCYRCLNCGATSGCS